MRSKNDPNKFAKLLARTTKSYGIEFVHCTPEDVDFENKTINGKILIENDWVSREVPIPAFIDFSAYCLKHKEVLNFLKEHSILSIYRKMSSKDVVNRKIVEDGEFAHLIIPSTTVENFETFHSFLEKYREIIIKPKNGQRGKGIYKLSITEDGYLLIIDNQEELLSKSDLFHFFDQKINAPRYLFQKYIPSITNNGDPFDCRIRLEKNGKGLWEVVIYLVRIGSGNKIVSNVSSGGSVSRLKPFLKANYGDKEPQIRADLKHVAKTLPYKLEKMFDTRLTSLGLDMGIDKDGTIYLFETNTAPGPEFALGEVALLRAEHYDYMLNKRSIRNESNPKDLKHHSL